MKKIYMFEGTELLSTNSSHVERKGDNVSVYDMLFVVEDVIVNVSKDDEYIIIILKSALEFQNFLYN